MVLLALARPQEALEQAQFACVCDPESEWPHRIRAIVLKRMGQTGAALVAASEAVRLAPTQRETLHTLALAELDARRWKEAERTLQALWKVAPDWPNTHVAWSIYFLRRKRWSEAEQAALEAIRLNPVEAAAHNNLGAALAGRGRWREALGAYEEAARIDPTFETAKSNLKRATKPASNTQIAVIVIRSIVLPWTIPIGVIQLAAGGLRSWRRTRALRPGSQMYVGRPYIKYVPWAVGAVGLLILALLAEMILGGSVWSPMRTPLLTSFLVAIALAIATTPAWQQFVSGTISRLKQSQGRKR